MFYDILDQMKQRPGLFPCESIEDIHTFIYGYYIAAMKHKVEDKELKEFNDGFLEFVQSEHQPHISHANWATVIRLHSATSQESFQNFFKLFDKFRKRVLA